jgi:hypothetical protein
VEISLIEAISMSTPSKDYDYRYAGEVTARLAHPGPGITAPDLVFIESEHLSSYIALSVTRRLPSWPRLSATS